jgi:hypothetical protein
VEDIAPRLGKLEDRMDASEQDRAGIHSDLSGMSDELAGLSLAVARIEELLASRTAFREKEHEAIVDAVVGRLTKQAGNGNA